MATAIDLIKRSLRLLGVLASGEEPEASESNDALAALNQMLDSWSTERLSVYGTVDQVLTWPAGLATAQLGPFSPTFGGSTLPIQLMDGTYYVVDGISRPITIINRDQYSSIVTKALTTQLPDFLFPNVNLSGPASDCMELTLYPVPNQDLEFHFIGVIPMTQVDNVVSDIHIPAGYQRAFTYNLALEIAAEFGVNPSQDVRRIASVSKRDLKRINNPMDVMNVPVSLLTGPRFNIYTGGY